MLRNNDGVAQSFFMSVIICVPTYNEEEAVKGIIELLRKADLDFVICDGFSTDKTVAIAKQLDAECVSRDKVGKGSAVAKCLEIARQRGYEYMGTIDCDLTYDVNDLTKLYQLTVQGDYDMVIGGRPFSKIAWHRRLANYFISAYFNLLFSSGIKDIVSGLRILKVEQFYDKIKADSFDLEPRILAYAVKNKLKYAEVPINYSERMGKSKANLIELYRILWGTTHERIKP